MKLARFGFRSINANLSHQSYSSHITRSLCTNPFSGNITEDNRTNESADDFERRMFGGGYGNGPSSKSFFRELDRLEKVRNRSSGWRNLNRVNGSSNWDDLDDGEESFQTTLSDGVVGKLQKAAKYFVFRPEDEEKIANDEEIDKDDYAFRPDVHFEPGMTYELKDLDLRKPRVRKAPVKNEFKVTTEEVLKKADFRNVRFLANFITDAGIIIKRRMTGISAKAQRKVAREIKTARAFGLMPFTTMGTKSFVFGKTMEDVPKNDVESRTYDHRGTVDFL